MKTAFVLYPDFTALDLVGPYEVISRWPDAEVHFLARSLEPVRCDEGLTVIPTDTPATLPDPELIVVPGSGKPIPVLSDQVLVDWLRTAAPNCKWTASVCTGAGLYAAAGAARGQDDDHALGVQGQPPRDGSRGRRRPRRVAGQPRQRRRCFRGNR